MLIWIGGEPRGLNHIEATKGKLRAAQQSSCIKSPEIGYPITKSQLENKYTSNLKQIEQVVCIYLEIHVTTLNEQGWLSLKKQGGKGWMAGLERKEGKKIYIIGVYKISNLKQWEGKKIKIILNLMLPSPSYRAGIRNGFYLPVSIGLYCPVMGSGIISQMECC